MVPGSGCCPAAGCFFEIGRAMESGSPKTRIAFCLRTKAPVDGRGHGRHVPGAKAELGRADKVGGLDEGEQTSAHICGGCPAWDRFPPCTSRRHHVSGALLFVQVISWSAKPRTFAEDCGTRFRVPGIGPKEVFNGGAHGGQSRGLKLAAVVTARVRSQDVKGKRFRRRLRGGKPPLRKIAVQRGASASRPGCAAL
jgi:hypothetical protein